MNFIREEIAASWAAAKQDWPYAVVALVMLALLICRMAAA